MKKGNGERLLKKNRARTPLSAVNFETERLLEEAIKPGSNPLATVRMREAVLLLKQQRVHHLLRTTAGKFHYCYTLSHSIYPLRLLLCESKRCYE
ncbi:hypothetical protein CDAR_407951 [Caerostris darwini]|uniref:Uncharacterized protein n=1 Tax=Caerostris darwini TaxID=1538125 RepID=A0AAV4PUM0_9ARAC|nr:hypothetical protein CDAR_407951 [Caerostris darwini]